MQVATRRTRTAGKVEIPNVDDHVSKLEHMGKETVKKLQDIKGSAVQSGIDINVPDNRIDKGAQTCLQPALASLTCLARPMQMCCASDMAKLKAPQSTSHYHSTPCICVTVRLCQQAGKRVTIVSGAKPGLCLWALGIPVS